MANSRISSLTSATTPLDGTEVLPIVQSSATKKVANNDLRPKQIQSNATSGVLQVVGPAAGATRVMTTPDANFTAARTDAAQSFTGDQTLGTGNLIQGTAAKGINFTANTPAAGMTSQLLNWYEEGTWTPTFTPYSGSFGSAATTSGLYVRIGRMVTIQWKCIINNNGTGSTLLQVGNLPFTPYVTGIDLFTGECVERFSKGGLYVLWFPSGSCLLIGSSTYTYPGSTGAEYYGTATYMTS